MLEKCTKHISEWTITLSYNSRDCPALWPQTKGNEDCRLQPMRPLHPHKWQWETTRQKRAGRTSNKTLSRWTQPRNSKYGRDQNKFQISKKYIWVRAMNKLWDKAMFTINANSLIPPRYLDTSPSSRLTWTRPQKAKQEMLRNPNLWWQVMSQSRLAATTSCPDPHRSTSRDATSQNRTCKDNASSRVPKANPDERKLRNGTSTARCGHFLPIIPGNIR